MIIQTLIATFTSPEGIGTNPQSMLWLLPLVAAISIVYKATKVHKITVGNFIKEVSILFGSIIVFMTIAGLVLFFLAWFFLE